MEKENKNPLFRIECYLDSKKELYIYDLFDWNGNKVQTFTMTKEQIEKNNALWNSIKTDLPEIHQIGGHGYETNI